MAPAQDDRIGAKGLDRTRFLGQGRCPSEAFSYNTQVARRHRGLARATSPPRKQTGKQPLVRESPDEAAVDPAFTPRRRDRRDLASDGSGEPSQFVAVRHDWRAPPSMTMPWPVMPRATSGHR